MKSTVQHRRRYVGCVFVSQVIFARRQEQLLITPVDEHSVVMYIRMLYKRWRCSCH